MDLKKEVENIIERNKRVESDKAWEISRTRRSIIAMMTYLLIVLFLWVINIPKPWLNALIPALAFIISTLTLPFFKKLWLNRR